MITAAHSDACPLSRFVEHVTRESDSNNSLTVNHVKLGIRAERMSEITNWANSDLDAIELHVAQFDGNAPLTVVFDQPFDRYPVDNGRSLAGVCAPSPFAWT